MYSPSDDDCVILHAADNGDLEMLKKLREKSGNREMFRNRCEIVSDCQGWTALHYASSNGRIHVCRFLVDTVKVDIDVKTLRGFSPLLLALEGGETSTAKYLIIRGADIHLSDSKGLTSLHYAAKQVNKELMQMLLFKGSDIEGRSVYGTPLEFAASCGSNVSVRFLLDRGAKSGGDPGTRPLIGTGSNSVHASDDLSHLVKKKGNEAVKRKDYRDAIKWYSEAINLDPTDATMLYLRSLCWANLHEATNALFDAEACVKLRPDWSKAHYTEGIAWKLLKNYPMTAEALVKASKLDPEDEEIGNALREAICLEFQDMAAKHPLEASKIIQDFNL